MLRDPLERYREKRDFGRTAEPAGSRRRSAGRRRELRYVIQKHAARREHYDFRLEHDGVMLSWACPKGPSLDPNDKRLAVRVEDHPIEYASFEGTIPKGQYGGGTVMLWDRGHWRPHGDVEEGLRKGKLGFDLDGERLRGRFALVKLRSRGKADRGDNWLLIKERDEMATSRGRPITETAVTSVETGRTMEEIARGGDVWNSDRDDGRAKTKRRGAQAGAKKKSGAASLPPFVPPQLATLADRPPAGGGWLHELKYDGYRALASIGGGSVVIRTRTGLDWTDRFAPLVAPLSELRCRSALIDGEVAVADVRGHTDFGALQDALSRRGGGFGYYVFDLLHLDGKDLRPLPLRERKARLKRLLQSAPKQGPLFYSDHIEGEGAKVFARACELGLEGIVCKRADDPYRSGRTRSWLKVKCGTAQEFVIIGWRPSAKAGRPFASLLLGVRDESGRLRYCGRVGTGYTETRLDELAALFKKHARRTPPVPDVPRAIARDAKFLEPVLVAEIEFRGWTRDGLVRQGAFKGLRTDKPATEVIRERAMPTMRITGSDTRSAGRAGGAQAPETFEGVRVTHPDRVLFPGQGVSKRQLIEYYLAVADRMLPHVANRPLALVRCPQGRDKECFFQKHANPGWPDEFKSVRITEKSGSDDYLYIEDERGLIAAVQMGVLELHVWGSRVGSIEAPDRMIFDLDPDEGLPFDRVKEAARDLKRRLEDVGLKSFAMATGGKGIHVVVPLLPGHDWDQHRDFAEAMARLMAEEEPERYVANMSKAKRRGKIFVDYLRNQRGATAIAPYSTRAKRGAYVAFPVSWQALGRLKDAHPASVENAVQKIARTKDPWSGYHQVRQKLPLKSLGV